MIKNLSNKTIGLIYPCGKVHPKYLTYVGWYSLSNMIVSMENVISTHSMLSVLGKVSTELTLSVNFIGKDLIGQVGALTYMNKMGKKADKEPQKFIKNSMILQQSSVFLESFTPLLPIEAFIPVAGLSNIMMNISFTGFGAINAKIIPKLAEDDNVGEIYAKLTVINTIASSLGMGLGLGVVAFIPDHSMRICILPILASIRIYSYKKAIHELI
jgi:hypothetical protein